MPPLPPAPPAARLGDAALQLLQANHAALLEKYRAEARQEREDNQHAKHKYEWKQERLKRYEAIKPAWLEAAIRVFNGEASKGEAQPLKNNQMREPVEIQGKLAGLPDFGVAHMARWLQATRRNIFHFWHDDFFQQWLARQDLSTFDLRLLARAMREAGDEHDSVAMACMGSNWWGAKPQQVLAADMVWPLFAERPELIEQGLGLRAVERRQGVAPELAWRLVRLGGQLRQLGGHDLDEGASTRLLVYAARLMASGMPARRACEVALAEPLSDEPDTLAALRAVIDTQFGS